MEFPILNHLNFSKFLLDKNNNPGWNLEDKNVRSCMYKCIIDNNNVIRVKIQNEKIFLLRTFHTKFHGIKIPSCL